MKLEGRSAFITEGASGLGKATTRLVLENGAEVTGADCDSDRLQQTVEELAPLGALHAVLGDVASMADSARIVAEAANRVVSNLVVLRMFRDRDQPGASDADRR